MLPMLYENINVTSSLLALRVQSSGRQCGTDFLEYHKETLQADYTSSSPNPCPPNTPTLHSNTSSAFHSPHVLSLLYTIQPLLHLSFFLPHFSFSPLPLSFLLQHLPVSESPAKLMTWDYPEDHRKPCCSYLYAQRKFLPPHTSRYSNGV